MLPTDRRRGYLMLSYLTVELPAPATEIATLAAVAKLTNSATMSLTPRTRWTRSIRRIARLVRTTWRCSVDKSENRSGLFRATAMYRSYEDQRAEGGHAKSYQPCIFSKNALLIGRCKVQVRTVRRCAAELLPQHTIRARAYDANRIAAKLVECAAYRPLNINHAQILARMAAGGLAPRDPG